MPRIFVLLVSFGMALIVSTSLVSASGEPSVDARGMPGAGGTFEFKPSDWMAGTTSWCIAKGSVKGVCVVAASPPCERSAICKCE
jgi:hypothetical protein